MITSNYHNWSDVFIIYLIYNTLITKTIIPHSYTKLHCSVSTLQSKHIYYKFDSDYNINFYYNISTSANVKIICTQKYALNIMWTYNEF